MILAAALLLAAGAASPGGLDAARAAFTDGDYAAAERLATEAAQPPEAAAALYLAGLARFRAGRPADALEALDRAADGADSPEAWQFNRAACLYALGRFDDAEAAFLAAAARPELAALSLVNAGWAALDGGAPDRAAALAARAREAAGSGGAQALVAELEAGVASARAEDVAPALPPSSPVPGAPPGPGADARAWRAAARVEGGWDGDALQLDVGATERGGTATARAPSAFTAAGAEVRWGAALGGAARAEASYRVSQLAYTALAAEDRSTQQHELVATLRRSPRAGVSLALSAEGQLAFTGLSSFRGLQGAGGLRLGVDVDEGRRATSRLEAGWWRKQGLSPEFAALDGDRLDVSAAQELRVGNLTLRGAYRFRLERIGAVSSAPTSVPPSPICPDGCTAVAVEPLGYRASTASATAHLAVLPRVELDLGGGVEWRDRLEDAHRVLTRPDGSWIASDGQRWHERRAFTSVDAAVRLGPALSVFLRHELLRQTTAASGAAPGGMRCGPMDPRCSDADSTPRTKQVVLLGTSLGW